MLLYNVVEIVMMSGEVACCSVVCGTLVGVSVFSIMCSELMIIYLIEFIHEVYRYTKIYINTVIRNIKM